MESTEQEVEVKEKALGVCVGERNVDNHEAELVEEQNPVGKSTLDF